MLSIIPFSFIYVYNKHDDFKGLKIENLGDIPALEIGDIIFRYGIGVDSELIAKASGGNLTHVGIIVSLNPTQILHASTEDNPKLKNQVILSSLEEFLSHATNIAIKRYKLSPNDKSYITKTYSRYVGRAFVIEDKDSIDKLYCTTLIEELLNPLVNLHASYSTLDIAVVRLKILYPITLFNDDRSTLIYQYKPL